MFAKNANNERKMGVPGSGNVEDSGNAGSGLGDFRLLMFFPFACLCLPFVTTVFSGSLFLSCSFVSFLLMVF
jgi:hypothetical protein